MLDAAACYRAVRSRDRRFEGRFVVAVATTGVYCRPGCPAPIPLERNVRFFQQAAAAEAAGFRACLRCRPDAAPGSPAWLGTSATVARALSLIGEGRLDEEGVDGVAARLGVGGRHLRRLFAEQLGASPLQLAATRRAHFARRLIEETDLPFAEIAHAAGYASVRRFNAAIRELFRKPPSALRRTHAPAAGLTLRLPVRAPYDWARLHAFLKQRAVDGLEAVDESGWRRVVEIDGSAGVAWVRPAESALLLTVDVPRVGRGLMALVERVGRVFDVKADPLAIAAQLARDPRLKKRVRARPGLRVPGHFDPFEALVRALLGQQVSVERARKLTVALVERFGRRVEVAPGLTHLFPTPAQLVAADIRSLGMPNARAEAIRSAARAAVEGELRLDALPGVGPWTRGYVEMRGFGNPDAYPVADLGLKKCFGGDARALERAAERWRPFRAYAAMHLWSES